MLLELLPCRAEHPVSVAGRYMPPSRCEHGLRPCRLPAGARERGRWSPTPVPPLCRAVDKLPPLAPELANGLSPCIFSDVFLPVFHSWVPISCSAFYVFVLHVMRGESFVHTYSYNICPWSCAMWLMRCHTAEELMQGYRTPRPPCACPDRDPSRASAPPVAEMREQTERDRYADA